MPLLEIKTARKVTVLCTLEQSTVESVDHYAAFVNASGDDVVNKAIEYVLNKDTEFQKYRNTNPKVTPALRVKKAASTPNGARRGPKPGTNSATAS